MTFTSSVPPIVRVRDRAVIDPKVEAARVEQERLDLLKATAQQHRQEFDAMLNESEPVDDVYRRHELVEGDRRREAVKSQVTEAEWEYIKKEVGNWKYSATDQMSGAAYEKELARLR